MTNVTIEAGTLTASRQDRIVSGLLLPYGEVGRTNLGKFSVDPGTVTIPSDVSVLAANTDHDRENPVARFLTAVETAAGIVASFTIGKNPEGDALLAEIADHTNPDRRNRLSAEVKNIVLRAGKSVGGTLFGAAFVKAGAFPSAALMATDVGDLEDDPDPKPDDPEETESKTVDEYTDEDGVTHKRTTTRKTKVVGGVTTITETIVIEEPEPEPTTPEGDPAVGNNIPNTLNAGARTKPRGLSLPDMGRLLFAARDSGQVTEEAVNMLTTHNGAALYGALDDVKFDGAGGLAPTMTQPQWIDEVWDATTYIQQVLPLFTHADLTSLTWNGYRWVDKATGGDWAGNKANVPSSTLTVQAVSGKADRYAIGHDIAREFEDFPVPGFFESYAAAVGEDYSRWADNKVAAAVLAAATPLAGDALTTLPGVAGGTIGSAASAIIDGATAIVNLGTLPTFALVSPALWKQMAKTPQSNVIGYLSLALGFKEGELESFVIRPSASVAAGKTLVGAGQAATVYELPGAPIRIDALDLARGGIDKAAFGYVGVNINDARALQLVTAATA